MVGLLFAAPTLAADVFHAAEPAMVSLSRHTVTSTADAELKVTRRTIEAPFGIRREAGREQFSSSVALALGETYIVRDAKGVTHWVQISIPSDGFIDVEVVGDVEAPRQLFSGGRFKNATVIVNGTPTEVTFGSLVLEEDGKYRLGQVRGEWNPSRGGVVLSAGYAAWGRGQLSADGRELRFRFYRGSLIWEVTFMRTDAAPPVASAR
jgi:hypothetical protein